MTGEGHPEQPARTVVIAEALKRAGLLKNQNTIKPRVATQEEIALCHEWPYIQKVKNESLHSDPHGNTFISTGDAPLCPNSFEIACLAVGGVLEAIDAVMLGSYKRVFCVVRPPGHHALAAIGMGFCLFNNVAIAARYAQQKYGLERILIVDWDVHHGNGTQAIFYEDPSVFYFSTHQSGIYPLTGAENEKGVGNIVNVPILRGAHSRLEVLKAFEKKLPPLMDKFRPELILISSGFDAHERDPLGGFTLTDPDFGRLTTVITDIADLYAKGNVISVLEGGYDLQALKTASVTHVQALTQM